MPQQLGQRGPSTRPSCPQLLHIVVASPRAGWPVVERRTPHARRSFTSPHRLAKAAGTPGVGVAVGATCQAARCLQPCKASQPSSIARRVAVSLTQAACPARRCLPNEGRVLPWSPPLCSSIGCWRERRGWGAGLPSLGLGQRHHFTSICLRIHQRHGFECCGPMFLSAPAGRILNRSVRPGRAPLK